jgi:ubiquinone/menaquinone biosynthesis C-methylase UbiE
MMLNLFKRTFKGVTLKVEDLYLLESFQIGYLAGYVAERDLAAVLWAYPPIKIFLEKKFPQISDFVARIMTKYGPAVNELELAECSDRLVWTIADLLVYNKCPEAYDTLEFHSWDFREVTMVTPLDHKVVIDGGAGTGRVTLEAARTARQVFAVEPVTRLRQFIREKALKAGLGNIFVIDGFLHAIPLPDRSANIFITSHALGWQLEDELREIERVTKKGGTIIHCPGSAEEDSDEYKHSRLISSDWNYEFSRYKETDGWKRKYWKQL